MTQNPAGIHLCGSIPLDSAQQVFEQIGARLGSSLYRIPDGETNGSRQNWMFCQSHLFRGNENELVHPNVISLASGFTSPPRENAKPKKVHEYEGILKDLRPGYDTWAIDSYKAFRAARDAGAIPQHVRFQVSIPTPFAVVTMMVDRVHRDVVEKIYARKLQDCLTHIQEAIPHRDLSIQWDYSVEIAVLEEIRAYGPLTELLEHHFEKDTNVGAEIFQRLMELTQWVEPDVELGFHLCYGDLMHLHFKEPEDTTTVSRIIHVLLKNSNRKIDFIHIPVPRYRNDAQYLMPLTGDALPMLAEQDTQLFLGLVHAHDEFGSKDKTKIAKQVLSGTQGLRWGIATECGWGRTPKAEIGSIIDISAKLARYVKSVDEQVDELDSSSSSLVSDGSAYSSA